SACRGAPAVKAPSKTHNGSLKQPLSLFQAPALRERQFFWYHPLCSVPLREQELGKPAHQCFFISPTRATSTSVCLLHLRGDTRSIPHVRVRPEHTTVRPVASGCHPAPVSSGQEGHGVHSRSNHHSDHGTRRARAPPGTGGGRFRRRAPEGPEDPGSGRPLGRTST